MTVDQQFFLLITPEAVITAVASGIVFALVIHGLRPRAEANLIAYLVIVLGAIWYMSQWAALWIFEGTGWGTLGRWSLYTFAFVPAMWATLKWKSRP